MDERKVETKPETVREWYVRTTRRSWNIFVISSAISGSIMAFMWLFAKFETLHRLQLFNGALVIPLAGGLWIFLFIFHYLAPSREVGFRGQETLDALKDAATPVIEIWKRVGLQVEKELPDVLKQLRQSVEDLKNTSKKIETALVENENFVKDARPVLVSLKKIEEKFETEVVEDLKFIIDSAKRMSSLPPNAMGGGDLKPSEPNLSRALSNIGRKKAEAQPKA